MGQEEPDGESAPWTAGTITVLRSEAERVRLLSRSLDDLAVDLRQVDPDSWSGKAHDAFVDRRNAQAARCRTAAEAHAGAARALHDYVSVLEQLTRGAQYASDSSALQDLSRQRADAAREASVALSRARDELAALRATLGEIDRAGPRPRPRPVPVPVPAPATPPERPSMSRVQSVLAPDLILTNPVEFDRKLQELSDAMWLYWSPPGARSR